MSDQPISSSDPISSTPPASDDGPKFNARDQRVCGAKLRRKHARCHSVILIARVMRCRRCVGATVRSEVLQWVTFGRLAR